MGYNRSMKALFSRIKHFAVRIFLRASALFRPKPAMPAPEAAPAVEPAPAPSEDLPVTVEEPASDAVVVSIAEHQHQK